MNFHVVNNEILVPVKCGSTYLDNIYPNNIVNIWHYFDLFNLKGISAIIIREPLEHLQSALHTELLRWYHIHPNEILSAETAVPLISNFLGNGTTHWDINYYEHIYKFWKQNKDTIKIVHVSNLTDFLKQKYGINIPHNKFGYGILKLVGKFKYAYITKQKLSKWIEETLPELWNEVVKDLPKAEKFYNHLINETDYIEYDLLNIEYDYKKYKKLI